MSTPSVSGEVFVQAPAGAVFSVWSDVAAWPRWDPDTAAASINGPFAAGTAGRLKPRKGLAVKMSLTEVTPDRSFTVVCPVLGSTMRFEHRLWEEGGGVRVRHEVFFEGWLAPLLSRTVGRDVQRGLPVTLASLKRYVEQR